MSIELYNQIKSLFAENENLKKQALQTSQGVQSLLAQLEAYKQELFERVNSLIILRTNVVLLQKSNKELSDKIESLNKEIENKNQSLEDATQQIVDFEVATNKP